MRSPRVLLCALPLLFTAAAFAASNRTEASAVAEVAKSTAAAPSAADVFARMSALVGDWTGTFENGRAHLVNYRLSAGGTVLVETWALAPGRESITIYYVDGDELLATHYCPQGNQPRLRLISGTNRDRFDFALKDGGNLSVPGGWHQHLMWLQLGDTDSFSRSETYVENGSTAEQIAKVEEGGVVIYRRVIARS
jgi:hypothetical protein